MVAAAAPANPAAESCQEPADSTRCRRQEPATTQGGRTRADDRAFPSRIRNRGSEGCSYHDQSSPDSGLVKPPDQSRRAASFGTCCNPGTGIAQQRHQDTRQTESNSFLALFVTLCLSDNVLCRTWGCKCFVDRNIRECKMEVVLQPSGCHWVMRAACRAACRDRLIVYMPDVAAGVCAPERRGQGSLPLTPGFVKPIIPAL